MIDDVKFSRKDKIIASVLGLWGGIAFGLVTVRALENDAGSFFIGVAVGMLIACGVMIWSLLR